MTRLEQLLADGTLRRLAPGCRTLRELAEKCGMTSDAWVNSAARIRKAGRDFPGLLELQGWTSPYRDADKTIETPIEWEDFETGQKTDPIPRGTWLPNCPLVMAPPDEKPLSASASSTKPLVSMESAQPDPPFTAMPQTFVHRLNETDVPSGSIIGVLSDIHIPSHDEHAMRLVVDCLEDAGVTHVFLNGDIADCGPASRHPDKRQRAMLNEGDLRESVAPGLWIYEWARSKRCIYTLGNHEAWVVDLIAKSPELRGTPATELMGLPRDGDGWTVLPPLSRVRMGSRCWEHLDGFFKTGNGGANPCARIKAMAPDQTTSGGHLHRRASLFWTNEDEYGIPKTHGAYINGHLSLPSTHSEYMGSYMNWQQSFEITRTWDDGGRPRFTTDQVEIYRTKQGRPIFEYAGKVYGR